MELVPIMNGASSPKNVYRSNIYFSINLMIRCHKSSTVSCSKTVENEIMELVPIMNIFFLFFILCLIIGCDKSSKKCYDQKQWSIKEGLVPIMDGSRKIYFHSLSKLQSIMRVIFLTGNFNETSNSKKSDLILIRNFFNHFVRYRQYFMEDIFGGNINV